MACFSYSSRWSMLFSWLGRAEDTNLFLNKIVDITADRSQGKSQASRNGGSHTSQSKREKNYPRISYREQTLL